MENFFDGEYLKWHDKNWIALSMDLYQPKSFLIAPGLEEMPKAWKSYVYFLQKPVIEEYL